MVTTRGRMIRLLDAHPWTPPTTLPDAASFHDTLAPLRDTARTLHDDDRISRLVPLRLDLYLVHWPRPPRPDQLPAYLADAKGLCRHDIPRLKQLLMWAPATLPEQRTPRLGVPSMNTA